MELNKQQQKAAIAEKGISLVLAGAGTGKTKTVVEKVKNIIKSNMLKAENILLLTFSREAANEISQRISKSGVEKNYTTGTFQLSEINGVPVDAVMGIINKKDILKKNKNSSLFYVLNKISEIYKMKKKEAGFMDFDDMIYYAVKLLKQNDKIRCEILNCYRYIVVDEFQDTSDDNFELLKLLLPESGGNLFAVGDDYQSIYGFRDANIDYIVKFKKYFPNAKIHKLIINYRSNHEIVKVSNKFILLNKKRSKKKLLSFNGKGGVVKFHIVENFNNEVEKIEEIINDSLKETAVLYRNNNYGFMLKENLNSLNLTYMTFHGSKGLEFEKVIIAGIHDKIIPDRTTDIEEERRLFYVALSRAKSELHVIIYKNSNGNISRFGRELGINL